MSPKSIIIAGATIMLLILLILISFLFYIGTATPYSVFSSSGNGYSEMARILSAKLTSNLRELTRNNCDNISLIVPLARSKEHIVSSLEKLIKIVKCGGLVVLLDEKGYSNKFFAREDLGIIVDNTTVLDEISKHNSRFYPLVKTSIIRGNKVFELEVVSYKPSSIEIRPYPVLRVEIDVLGKTSSYSYSDRNSDGYYSIGDDLGEKNVVIALRIGKGKLYLISDLDVFTNDLLKIKSNRILLKTIVEKRPTYIYVKYLWFSTLDYVKYYLYRLGFNEKRGELIELFFLASLIMVGYVAERRKK